MLTPSFFRGIDVEAAGAMLGYLKRHLPHGGGRYVSCMASFTLDGETYEYLKPDPGHPAEETNSWEYGNYPKVIARSS